MTESSPKKRGIRVLTAANVASQQQSERIRHETDRNALIQIGVLSCQIPCYSNSRLL